MTPTRRDEGTSPPRGPVFLDESGRRRRWVNRSGACLAVVCVAYAAVVGSEMAQTGVGALTYVPAAGNGLITGFPTDPAVPGLLAAGVKNQGRTAGGAIRPVATVGPRSEAASPAGPHVQPVHTRSQTNTSRSTRSPSASTASPATSARTRRSLT